MLCAMEMYTTGCRGVWGGRVGVCVWVGWLDVRKFHLTEPVCSQGTPYMVVLHILGRVCVCVCVCVCELDCI